MRRLFFMLAAVTLLAAACGDDGGDSAASPDDTTTSSAADGSSTATDDVPAVDLGRVVVLGEEYVLADLMALGITPVAATATVDDTFRGVEHDTSDIEVLNATEPNVEQLATLNPDLIVAGDYVVENVGLDVLEGIAPTIVVEFGGWRETLLTLAADLEEAGATGATEQAEALLDEYDEAIAASAEEIDPSVVVSMATVYSGENLAVWVDGPWAVGQAFVDAGVTLRPGPDAYDDVTNGRAWISTELLGDLDGDVLVLQQTTAVEGEDAALAAIQATDRWAQLPAVQNERVVVVDRLGYPGVEGRIRLAQELPAILG